MYGLTRSSVIVPVVPFPFPGLFVISMGTNVVAVMVTNLIPTILTKVNTVLSDSRRN